MYLITSAYRVIWELLCTYLKTLVTETGVIESVAKSRYEDRERWRWQSAVAHYGIKRL